MGELARLQMEIRGRKQRATELAAEIDRKIRDIKDALTGHALKKPEELRLSMIAEISAQLEKLQEEYLQVLQEIKIAEKEIGE